MRLTVSSLTLAALLGSAIAAADDFVLPARPDQFTVSVPYEAVGRILAEADKAPHVTVTEEGTSVEGRTLWMAHIQRGKSANPWKVFFFGQQHGNEPAGKDALVWMVDDFARHPENLPEGIDLYILPMVNPDGAEANRRTNSNAKDLNRDHVTLGQPEVQTLHRVTQRVMPHVTVDCHEFVRDSPDFIAKGWTEWPLIMMDSGNHPLFDPTVTAASLRWVEDMKPAMAAGGFNYTRYFVGGAHPEECRHSHPELDDARNGLGVYGQLSFIIESGAYRNSGTPGADLPQRVASYHTLLSGFLTNDSHREADRAAIEHARRRALPPFIPTNYFWANVGLKVRSMPVVEQATGKVLEIPTASFFDDLIVKTVVPTPVGYAIPAEQAPLFAPWFERHGIQFETLTAPRKATAQTSELVRIEEDDDPIYGRYGGRSITKVGESAEVELPIGTLIVPLAQPNPFKPAIYLEPGMIYGLSKYDEFAGIRDKGMPLRLLD